MGKFKSGIIVTIVCIILFLFFHWLWNLNFVEDFFGSWMGGLDPHRSQHLREELQVRSNNELFKLLDHGDYTKAAVAASLLAERAPKELFEPISEKLGSRSKEVRMSARRIIQYIDKERTTELLMRDLEKINKNSSDYEDTLRMLSYMKYHPVYPYVIEYAQRPNGWRNASALYLEELGNPEAIPILQEMLTKVDDKFVLANSERERIQKAIRTLEAIASEKGIAS